MTTDYPWYGLANVAMAVDRQGAPHLLFASAENGILHYARWNGSEWADQELDSGIGYAGVALALDSANAPHLAYVAGRHLKYAAPGTAGWAIQDLAPPGDRATVGELALRLDDAGRPHIAYRYTDLALSWQGELLYTRWHDGAWQTASVDRESGYLGRGLALALEPAGRPLIAYAGSQYGDLRQATGLPRRSAPPCPIDAAPLTVKGTRASTSGSVQRQVDRCADDAHVKLGDSADLYDSSRYLRTGGGKGGLADAGQYVAGLRFRGLDVPHGAHIVSAQLVLEPWMGVASPITLEVAGELQPSTSEFAVDHPWPHERPKTALRVQWRLAPGDGAVESPDLARIVQEVVAQTGWQTGNSLTLIISPLGWGQPRTDWAAFDLNPLAAARLTIRYELEPPTPTPTATACLRRRPHRPFRRPPLPRVRPR